MVSQADLICKGYHSWVPSLISILLETVWVPLIGSKWSYIQSKKRVPCVSGLLLNKGIRYRILLYNCVICVFFVENKPEIDGVLRTALRFYSDAAENYIKVQLT